MTRGWRGEHGRRRWSWRDAGLGQGFGAAGAKSTAQSSRASSTAATATAREAWLEGRLDPAFGGPPAHYGCFPLSYSILRQVPPQASPHPADFHPCAPATPALREPSCFPHSSRQTLGMTVTDQPQRSLISGLRQGRVASCTAVEVPSPEEREPSRAAFIQENVQSACSCVWRR